jgi:hypothetical protein
LFHKEGSVRMILRLAQQIEPLGLAGVDGIGNAEVAIAIKVTTADLYPVG